ncbi:MAG TPA: C4-dicarboxylate ABC transporter substrate-binding protein, partial [Rectinema sp.]|nr:C4-dicarboxylate ABC transporter substrate-binding protein [Rectinema sp.]
MKKTIVAMMVLLLLASSTAFAQQKPIKLVFTSVSVPTDAHTQAMYVFEEEVERLSGGQIQVDVYDSGKLFTQQAEQDAIRKGTVDMVYSSASWLAEFVPYLSMFGAAY